MSSIKNLLLFVLLFFSFTSKSQSVFPLFSSNAHFNDYECFWFDCWTRQYYFEKDTFLCGNNYSKINSLPGYPNVFVRNDSLKTFYRTSTDCSQREYKLYDYSIAVHDTTYVGFQIDFNNTADTTAYLLEQIDTVTYFGISRQRFKMKYSPENEGNLYRYMYWIKGIGSEIHPFFPFFCLSDGCENSYRLLCADSSGMQIYQNEYTNDCITFTLEIPENKSDFSISSNPFSSELQIINTNNLPLTFQLFSLNGTSIIESTFQNDAVIPINTTNLNAGSYFLSISSENTTHILKVTKIE